MKRSVRVVGTLVFTSLAVAYLIWKVDISRTADVLAETDPAWFALAVAIMLLAVVPMALRWKWLLAAHGLPDHLPWLVRSYLVSYTAGQILPTAIGGDAVRILESSRRHGGRLGDLSAIVLLERGLGGAATVVLGAIGFVLAIGRYDVGAYLWLEGAFVIGTIVLAFLFFARSARPLLVRGVPVLRWLRLERPVRALYEGVHEFRGHTRLLLMVFGLTLAVQSVRVLAIWASAKAVGVDESARLYYVMGPLLFLVMLVPFTLNGFAVREAFFVSFLGSAGVGANQAFAAGFLFFLVTLAVALPGGVILLWEGLRGARARPRVGHG
jgi:glycosyltransferase 2 family protein